MLINEPAVCYKLRVELVKAFAWCLYWTKNMQHMGKIKQIQKAKKAPAYKYF